MAGKYGVARLLSKHRSAIAVDLDVRAVLPILIRKTIFTYADECEILSQPDARQRAEVFIDILSEKGYDAFKEFCLALESSCPHLLTSFLVNSSEIAECDKAPTPALQLGLELALRERDTALRENARAIEERNVAQRQFEAMRVARDQALSDCKSTKPSNRELELNHNNNMDNSLYDYKNNLSSSYHKSWDKTRQFDVDVEQDEVSDIWLLLRNVCLSLKPDVIELENAACDGGEVEMG
ncbi:hypothetical protein LSAT2_016749 [Lamellibrachia satsuma]|nr:hypothetical protein LSAT2_016749 [Lamellibrachia satsuma]